MASSLLFAQGDVFQDKDLTFRFPSGWVLQRSGEAITIAPSSAHVRTSSNKEWLTHGIFVGRMPSQVGDLSSAIDTIFGVSRKSDFYLSKVRRASTFTIVGKSAVSQEYRNDNPDAPGPESGFIVVIDNNPEYVYLILFCPAAEKEKYLPQFQNVLASIRLTSVTGSTLPQQNLSAKKIGGIYVEPSTVLVRQTVQVGAGKILAYNFNLERGTQLVADFSVAGGLNNRVDILLLDLPNYQLYSAGQKFSYFRGSSGAVQQVAKTTFVVPSTNLYYLVLDNRRAWLLNRSVRLYVYAISPHATAESEQQEKALQTLYDKLKTAFMFPDFKLNVRHCGLVNAFSNPDITICNELMEELSDQGLKTAPVFVFFHELGHSLLRQWGMPLYDNEDVADEFATVFSIMGKQQGSALEAAQWFASKTSTQQAIAELYIDDRHTLSPQRARNIIRWLNNSSDLVGRWQKILVPNMQTPMLEGMMHDPMVSDRDFVRSELTRRGVSSP